MNRWIQMVIGLSVFASVTEARAAVYYANYAPANGEINASVGGLNARSLIASGRMGLKFWNNTSSTEAGLLSTCKSKSPIGTTWKEGCDFGGLTATLSATSGSWTKGMDLAQTTGLNAIIAGLSIHHSPVLVPLYGHATHWGTIYMVDAVGSSINGLEWYDSGPANVSDGQYTYYQDGKQGCDGVTFNNTYYKVLNSAYLSASDPYLGKYLSSYDPPFGFSPEQAHAYVQRMPPATLEKAPGVLDKEEQMGPEVAQSRVWDALLAANVQNSKDLWAPIERGWADLGIEVHGRTPDGRPWEYYLVPIRDDDGSALGLVQMSSEDGAYQQIWVGARPFEYVGLIPERAAAIAASQLRSGEDLYGGELTWGADVEDPVVPSPLFPYYEYHKFANDGTYAGRILVALRDGAVITPDEGSTKTARR